MVIDTALLLSVSEQAKNNPRLRQNYDLRNNTDDKSQRMLNALEPGTVMPIHRHRNSSETMIVIKGSLKELFYDDNGNIIGEWICAPNTDCIGMNIPAGQWHNLICLEPGTVLFEAKDGPWEPLSEEDVLEK
ncbi:MAG: WbuC family cupin fold metalloprotein [Bacteroidales bacterium]|nr:WbuC family cupin fold metalloprotein [Bacteroidales bacterium]